MFKFHYLFANLKFFNLTHEISNLTLALLLSHLKTHKGRYEVNHKISTLRASSTALRSCTFACSSMPSSVVILYPRLALI